MTTHPSKRSSRQTASERLASDLRGLGPAGIFALTTIFLLGTLSIRNIAIPIGALLVLLWVRLSHTPWCAIGYVRPRSWPKTVVSGIVFGIVFKLLSKSVIMPLLGADPINQLYHHLAGNTALLPFAIWTMLVAGFAEETTFRGFAFERLRTLMGSGRWAVVLTVLLTSFFFGLAHYPQQGFTGAEHAVIMGLVFGTVYATTGRLFLLMIAHAAYDLTAIFLIYRRLEWDVAHFFFH
jgi:membrane protease YdiL (CAAX protease family)